MLARSYAQALYKSLTEATAKERSERFRAFRQILERKGHSRLAPAIMREFEKVALREKKRSEVRVRVAQEKDAGAAKKAAALIPEFQNKELVVSVDQSLIGGWTIEGEDGVLDKSFRRALLDLYRTLVS